MIKYDSVILATGSYLPERIVTNDELAAIVDTSDEWITTRTGIKQRHFAKENELVSQMAAKAAESALTKSGISKDKIDLIILATTTADKTFPATASTVQSILGAKNAAAFDLQAVCAGFIYALSVAHSFIQSGGAKNILVIGADKMSSLINWSDRGSCILFGDGAGAVVISAKEQSTAQNISRSGVLAVDINSDGDFNNILCTSGGITTTGSSGKLTMVGKEVFKHAVDKMASSLTKLFAKSSISKEQIDYLIPHQANQRIIEALSNKIGFNNEKIISTVAYHANTSAASIPLALDYAINAKKVRKGDLVALTAIGGGLSWGSCIIRL